MLDRVDGPTVVTRVLIRERGRQGSVAQREISGCYAAGFVDNGPRAEECRQPLEAGKGKETDSSLESPEGA